MCSFVHCVLLPSLYLWATVTSENTTGLLCPLDSGSGVCTVCESSPTYGPVYSQWEPPKAIFSNPGFRFCVACPPGSYFTTDPIDDSNILNLPDSTRGCRVCPEKTFRASPGGGDLSACLACPVGFTPNGRNTYEYEWRPDQTTRVTSGNTACLPCSAGTTTDGVGGSCTACLAGTFSPTPGSPCLPCPHTAPTPPNASYSSQLAQQQCDGAALEVAWNVTMVAGRAGLGGLQDGSVPPNSGTDAEPPPPTPAPPPPTFFYPMHLVATLDGSTLYIADSGNNAIRRVEVGRGGGNSIEGLGRAGWVPPVNVSTFYLSPKTLRIGSIGPVGIAYAPRSSLLLYSDWNTNCVYTLDLLPSHPPLPAPLLPNSSTPIRVAPPLRTRLAGSESPGYSDGQGTQASFFRPSGLAVDEEAGLVYCADYLNSRVRRVSLGTGEVVTLAGNPARGVAGMVNGIGTAATFNLPLAVALFAPKGMLYVADTGHGVIRSLDVGTGMVSTLVGQPGVRPVFMGMINPTSLFPFQCLDPTGLPTFVDGSTQYASMCAPTGLAVDASGYVYFTDNVVDLVRVVSPGGVVSSLAGSRNASGFTGVALTVTRDVDGVGERAGFSRPMGVAIDATTGTVYVSSTGAHTLRRLTPVPLVSDPTFPPGLVARLASLRQSMLPPPPLNCTPGYYCNGGPVEAMCTLPRVCLPQGCAPGYTGFLCAQCQQPVQQQQQQQQQKGGEGGTTFFLDPQRECAPCASNTPTPSTFWWAPLLGALAWLIVAALGVDRLGNALVWVGNWACGGGYTGINGGRGAGLSVVSSSVESPEGPSEIPSVGGAGGVTSGGSGAAKGRPPNPFLPIAWDMVVELLNRLSLYSRIVTFPFPGTFKTYLVWVGSVWGVNASFTGMECAIPGWSYPNTFALTLCVGVVGLGLSQWVAPRVPFERGGGVGSRGSTFPALFFPLLIQAAWQTLTFATPRPGGGSPFLVIQPSLALSPSLWMLYAAGALIFLDVWVRFWDIAGRAPSKSTFLQVLTCGGGGGKRGVGGGAGGGVISSIPTEDRMVVVASGGVGGAPHTQTIPPYLNPSHLHTSSTLTAALAPLPLPTATIATGRTTATALGGGGETLSPFMAVLKWWCYLVRGACGFALPFAITRDFSFDPLDPASLRWIFVSVLVDCLVSLLEWVVLVGVATQPYPPLPMALFLLTMTTVGGISRTIPTSRFISPQALIAVNIAFLVLAPTLAWALVKWSPLAWCRGCRAACVGRSLCPKGPSSLSIRHPPNAANASSLVFAAHRSRNSRRVSNPARNNRAAGGGNTINNSASGGDCDTDPQ